MPANRLTLRQRKTIFETLVTLQDTHRVSVAESKRQVMEKFEVNSEQIESIIQEGLEQDWLDETQTLEKVEG
jgi:hypothetical protein